MSDSVKVAIKVRPLIKREKDDNLPIQWSIQGNTIAAIDAEMRKRGDGGFEFDHIFDTNATNCNVFDMIVKPIVDAAVNGFNGTVFAYGQTSSGKTHTMMGTTEELGIIPLAVEHMFNAIAKTPAREFLLRVSYLEIYNERVNDLLCKNAVDLKVHEDGNGQVFVKCKEEVTNCPENVMLIMNKGNKNRRIGETNMNERSSRSHTIFRITIESRKAEADSDGAIQVSQLNLVDLAGSERARQTGATGERFKEGRHINLSLSTLALVIKQLSESQDAQKYINFRDSKLTRLLQTSLGGNAMTAIICAVTPAALDETQCTLSFASRARNIKNKPQLNEVMSDGVLLKRYAKQIDKLHAELERMKQLAGTAGTADFLEMETKMQEKDRINQDLENRIKLLQTRIVHGDIRNNTQSFKLKAKRRQTWCGTAGYKLNMSMFQSCANLSPIREMSPVKSFNGKSSDIIDASFQIAYTDFELELIKNEEDSLHDEESWLNSDEDSFVTCRRYREKLMDNVTQKSTTNHENCNTTPEKMNMYTQTARSPGTPKESLRNKICLLTEEYSQLQEYTTLEKQLYFEDHTNELKSKLATLEKEMDNVASDKNAFEHIASELRKKLTTAELRYLTAEDQLNAQLDELRKIPDLEKRAAQLSTMETEVQNIPELRKQISLLTTERDDFEHLASELRKKFNESEQRNVLLEDKLTTRNKAMPVMQISKLENRQSELESQIATMMSEKDELQHRIIDLQSKLAEAESCNNSMEDQLNELKQLTVQNLQELETQVKNLMFEKSELERTICEMQDKLKETEEINNSITDKLNEQQKEIQNLRDQEKQNERFMSERHEFELAISELQKKLSEAEMARDTMKSQMDHQMECQQAHKADEELQNQMQNAVREKTELEQINEELRDKLRELELTNNSLKNKLTEQELYVQKTCDLEKQIEDLTIEKNEFESVVAELKEKSKKTELMNNLLKDRLNECETDVHKINEQSEIADKTCASENSKLEHVISELQDKLRETESRNNSIKEELSIQQVETQRAIDEQRKCMENFALEKSELENTIRQLQEKSHEAELRSNLMQNRINQQESQLQKSHDLENEIECLTSRTREFECMIHELQEKLAKAERGILLEDESNEQQLPQIEEPKETQLEKLISEKDEYERVPQKLHNELLKSPEKENDHNADEINHLKNLHAIDEDIQKENALKEHTRSMMSDHDLSSDSKILSDLSRISLDEDSMRLSMDLLLKNQELDEIKHDVQSLKMDIVNLQKTIYLLTTENSDLANKLSAEKECAEKSTMNFQQTIEELYARNSKIMDEKLNAESNLAMLREQMESLRAKIPDANLNEKEIILKYEEQLSALTAKNTELLSNVADRMKELEMLKESKALLYEHDCMYKDKITNLAEKYECLTAEYNELSSDLMDKIEENDGLRQEYQILQSKLELSLRGKEDIDNDDSMKQLSRENTLLKTELMELKVNMKLLTEENSKLSNQLIETIEDLDNARTINSCNDVTLHLSTLFNNTSNMNDTIVNDKSMKDNNTETKILSLQEQVNHLTHLNRKLSELKLSACTQCTHLKELNESRRMLKLEVKSLSHKLEDLQRKFDCKSARSDVLILKAKEDVNLSLCNSSLNASFSENMNVTFIEDRLQSLSSEVQNLKEERNKLSSLYKEKCNEVEELQNSSVTDANDDLNDLSVKKSPNKTSSRLETVVKIMNDLQSDFEKIKENNESVRMDLAKFTSERDSLLVEINSLRIANEDLLKKLFDSEHSHTSALEKAEILENEVTDLTVKLQEITLKYREMENMKVLLEIDTESLKEDKALKERTINELRQNLSCLQHELDIIKEKQNEFNNDNNSLEQEYEKKLELLKNKNKELSDSKTSIEQKFVDYTKESENKLTELNEKLNKYTSENDYLKQELIKLRDIEDKFEKMRNEYQSKTQQDKMLIEDNKKLKNMLNDTSKNILKEIKALKPQMDTQGLQDKSVDELFQVFLQTILAKEEEIVRTMREHFDKRKQKLEDEKRQSIDSEKRTMLWAKELESEIEKLQADLFAREAVIDGLQKEIAHTQQLLEENHRDRDGLREKISLLETDLCNMQIELKKYSKIDTENEEAVVIAQKREKQAQEAIKNKEAEFQMKLKMDKETYNKRIEDLACTIDSFKTKNMELTNNIEGLEANQKQLKNIIDLKTNELLKSNQIIQKMQTESEQLTEAYNELTQELEEKKLRITEITEHLKTKCDELTEYKTNLETIMPENKLLKQQISERKTSIEQYKTEIQMLKMENTQEFDRLKDQLSFEELKNVELNKQIAELNNKNVTLTEEMKTLKEEHATLERKCASLERRVRNSTSKIQAEEQIEELKDLNKSLRNNLDGASNRMAELQTAKTELMKQLVTLKSQHDAMCNENHELKETLSSFKSKNGGSYEQYDALLQEKNKIALELEATKFQLTHKTKEIENCTTKIKELTEQNAELDRESDELANVIRENDIDNTRLQDQLYSCRTEIDTLNEKIETLNKKYSNIQETDGSSKKACDNECNYITLKKKIRELQLEIVSKNGKIATLELQIRSSSYPYQEKCKELQENLLSHRNKNIELKAEVKRLQTAMLRTCTKECDMCKQRYINKRNQACQTMPNNVVRFCGTSSGIIEEDIRIKKLEKEKAIMRDLCRSRSKLIKEQEKRINELEKLQSSNS